MNAPASSEIAQPRPASLPWACAILSAVLLVALPLFAGYGFSTSGTVGVAAATAAFGICLTCGILALCITAIAQKLNQGVQGVLGAMLVRMGVPLMALFVLPKVGGPLIATGVTGMVMAYYLITLAAETWLSLRFVPVPKLSDAKNAAAKVA